MHHILREDIRTFTLPAELTEYLRNSQIIVTGATGLIGSAFVKCVNALAIGVRFILPVRNEAKARELFKEETDAVTIIPTDLTDFFNSTSIGCDYIIHCASPTNGQYICSHPAETYLLAIESTKSILDYSVRTKVKEIVYASSIEYYGQIFDDKPITEEMMGYFDRQSPRNSYPLGKQAAEYLAFCYANEYCVPVKTARLTQTFGAGIDREDNRVFAQFARSVIDSRDIVLHTAGRSAKPYCYTTDTVAALIYILLKGNPGEAYNVATPGTYLTIRELAELYRDEFNPDINVRIESGHDTGYAPETTVNLNSDKLMALGWQPKHNLREMLRRLIGYLSTTE